MVCVVWWTIVIRRQLIDTLDDTFTPSVRFIYDHVSGQLSADICVSKTAPSSFFITCFPTRGLQTSLSTAMIIGDGLWSCRIRECLWCGCLALHGPEAMIHGMVGCIACKIQSQRHASIGMFSNLRLKSVIIHSHGRR